MRNSPAEAVPRTVPPRRLLRRLFLTLFLRGRSSRGLDKDRAPTSVGRKLWLTIGLYALLGCLAFGFLGQKTFAVAVYLHGMTFVFLGMFVAASAGEVLFNREEPDILLHRPIASRDLLWAKMGVLVEVSLWLAAAFNLVGFFVGAGSIDGGPLFILVHLFSSVLQALLCTGTVVLVYQLCLRWFGRERLDGLMTLAQMLVAIAAVGGGQMVPRILSRHNLVFDFGPDNWWLGVLPPAWFAGMDDAIAGSGAGGSWLLAGIGIVVTGTVLALAVGKLARTYEVGLQTLSESAVKRPGTRKHRRFTDRLVNSVPLSWWLREPAARASFLLTTAYLLRDRETKLRVYPGLAPMLVLPVIFLMNDSRQGDGREWALAFTSGYIGIVPLLGLNLVQYSQQWQAADLFRCSPLAGPAPLCKGARAAVLVLLTLPMLALFAVIIGALRGFDSGLALTLPGLILVPLYSLVPCLGGQAVPFSRPSEEGKSAGRGLRMISASFVAIAMSALTIMAWKLDWFGWLLAGEVLVGGGIYWIMHRAIGRTRWRSLE
ncbi:MAG TPA: hypothetical protein VEH04_00970 [Verrucomicrobiae bacterium]|nr:hypothetical protein [Verrucomicrobiae bacterium]